MIIPEDHPEQPFRTNDDILSDIWDALWNEDTIRSLDLGSLSIDVKGGDVTLTGHLARENHRSRIEGIARSAAGVVTVHDHLVYDFDLILQVALALTRDKRTCPFFLPVYGFHGWIHLGGEVPTRELQFVGEGVAGGVAGVRGVITLPHVKGENPNPPRRAIQPRIGAVAYGKDGEVGVVTQVVIHPHNRLVTHVVVRSDEISYINLVAHENVVPVKDIDLVKNDSLLLVRDGLSLNAYPAFDPDEYILAPFTWKAPYPYIAGEVRWSFLDVLKAESRPGLRPDTKARAKVERAPKQVNFKPVREQLSRQVENKRVPVVEKGGIALL